MAAVEAKHVDLPGDDANPQVEDDVDDSGPEGGSEDGGSEDEASDGGSEDEVSDGGSEDEVSDGGIAGEEEGGEPEKEQEDGNTNAGWAEAMAKILGKKSESKSSILTKNKELDKMKEKEREELLERKKQTDQKRAWEMMCREKTDIVKDREVEKALQRIATRGVVQLFNAVKKHQKNIDEKVKEVGGSERKKAKILSSVSKRDFIDVLRKTEEGSRSAATAEDSAAVKDEKPAWSILRDDFMMGATMKDWDKDSDKEDAQPQRQVEAEETDSD